MATSAKKKEVLRLSYAWLMDEAEGVLFGVGYFRRGPTSKATYGTSRIPPLIGRSFGLEAYNPAPSPPTSGCVIELELFGASGAAPLPAGVCLLEGFAVPCEAALLTDIGRVVAAAPFRHMITPGGQRMSAAMTNCGSAGWISDRSGYRYAGLDPHSGQPWPALPESFSTLARQAAEAAGFAGFAPDACLINRYVPGARMSLHQDRDERELSAPIVSVSLGLPAVFLLGGLERSARPVRVPLAHGDVIVWGGAARMIFHGVAPVAEGLHPGLGRQRINLTLRRAWRD